jgi:putative ABC transport system permease protein
MAPSITFNTIRVGAKSLMHHKLRSVLTMLGVVFGVGSVMAMLAVGEGASRQALERIRRLGANNLILSAVKPPDDPSKSQAKSFISVYGLTYEDQRRIAESIRQADRIVPAKIVTKQARLDDQTANLRVVGTTADWFDLVRRDLIAGRRLHEDDTRLQRDVCVLTEHGARKLLAGRNTVGQRLRIGKFVYEIVGIIQSEDSTDGGIQTPDREMDAYIPLNVARQHFSDMDIRAVSGSFQAEKVELHMLIVESRRIEDVQSMAAAVQSMLQRFHKKIDYQLSVPLSLLREAEATKRTFNIVLGSIAGISLLVGGIGIMNIMLASVIERTQEIGIRRAVGARRRHILSQFLVETLVLTTLGGLLGIAVGFLIPELIHRLAGMPTVVPLYSILLAFGISTTVGVVFGLYPAARAARVDPIIALRHS